MARPIKKVLFIEPRAPRPHIFSRVVIPRLGCVLLGTILRDQGLEVKVVVEEIAQPDYRTLDFQPDLVGISSISSTAPRAYELADFYRQQGIPVVLGGAHTSFLPGEGLEHADFVICGEGDEALPELVAMLNEGGDWRTVRNLAFKEGGEVRQNPWRPFVEDLDSLPIPDYRLIYGWKGNGAHCVSIATSRGCPFNCRFCSVILLFGRKYRYNSVDRVMEEIRVVGSQAHHIFFCDDNFTANRNRIKELCERILQENLKIEWSAQVRVEAAKDPELMELMARSGCYIVFVGLESINPATLEAYNKAQTVDSVKECVINFHKYGIRVHGMFPVPGTPFYQDMEAQNRIICKDWSQYDGHHAVFQPKQFTPYELQFETIRAMKKFYSFPSAIKRLIARDWFFAKLKLYARYLMWRSHWEKSNYPQQLRQQFFSRVRQLRRWLRGRGRISRVGIPADVWNLSTWEGKSREFLLRFLEKLGAEIVQEGEGETTAAGPVIAVRSEIARLQEKADLVLLPIWKGLEEARRRLDDLQELTRDTTTKLLPLEFSRCSFYSACMELGLLFQRRLSRIRRIYFQTLQEVGAEI